MKLLDDLCCFELFQIDHDSIVAASENNEVVDDGRLRRQRSATPMIEDDNEK